MAFEIAGLAFGDGAAANGDTGLMDRLGIARNQRMPPVEVLALVDQTVGAGRRQPFQAGQIGGSKFDAIGHQERALDIIGAQAGAHIQEPAGNVGIRDPSPVSSSSSL